MTDTDDKKFEETLRKLLKTPPQPKITPPKPKPGKGNKEAVGKKNSTES